MTCTHDPLPRTPGRRHRRPMSTSPSTAPPARITVDLTDNPDCLPVGVNLSEACSRTAAMVGVFNSLPQSVPANAGSFRRIEVRLRENCIVGIPRHPTSLLGGDDQPRRPRDQRGAARDGRDRSGARHGRGRRRHPAGLGRHFRPRSAPRRRALRQRGHPGRRRRRRAPSATTAGSRSFTMGNARHAVLRQHRDRRAAPSDPHRDQRASCRTARAPAPIAARPAC